MPSFRRGAAAIEEAASSKGGGGFRPFVPTIEWRDDRESKHVLFLTPVDEIPTVEYHDWIPVGKGQKANGETYTKYEQFISRKDPAIGESYDELQDRLDVRPKSRSIAVAVELDPITEKDDKGRDRVTGFVVATDTYIRKDENGNEEEVAQPLVGLVVQAAQNFFGWLSSYDASQGPIEETPMNVTRRGKDANTTYDFIALEGRTVDLNPLFDNIDGVSYLREEMADLVASLADLTDEDAAKAIADALLNKRLDELADKERYDEFVKPLEEVPSKFGAKKGAAKPAAKRERPQRASRRSAIETTQLAGPSETPQAAPEAAPAAEAAPVATTDRFARLRAKVEAQAAS